MNASGAPSNDFYSGQFCTPAVTVTPPTPDDEQQPRRPIFDRLFDDENRRRSKSGEAAAITKKNGRNQMLLTDLYPLRKRSLVTQIGNAVQKENEQQLATVREVLTQKASPLQKRGRQEDDMPSERPLSRLQHASSFNALAVSPPMSPPLTRTPPTLPLPTDGSMLVPPASSILSFGGMGSRCHSVAAIEDLNELLEEYEREEERVAVMGKLIDNMEDRLATADRQRKCGLPIVPNAPKVAHTISGDVLANLLRGHRYNMRSTDSYLIIDCRYPYEYDGGHVIGAINIWHKKSMEEHLFCDLPVPSGKSLDCNKIIIFYCEYSSFRAPDIYKAARNLDRHHVGAARYPLVYYPEMYLLEGGYRAFYTAYKDLCTPPSYVRMDDGPFKHERISCEAIRKSSVTSISSNAPTRFGRAKSSGRIKRHGARELPLFPGKIDSNTNRN